MNESNYVYTGCYGDLNIQCTVFVFKGWYCRKGAQTVNFTPRLITNNIPPYYNLKSYTDTDSRWSSKPIQSLDQLIRFVRFLERHSE